MGNDARLLLRSLPYLRPSQVPQRATRLVSERLVLRRLARGEGLRRSFATMPGVERSPRAALWSLRPEESAARAADVAQGTFEWMGVVRRYGDRVEWNDASVPRLWRFHLHAFDVAWPLALSGPDGGATIARLFADWLGANPPRRGDAWHPFVVAERLINLLGTREMWSQHLDDPASDLWRQAGYLARALEVDIGGNHLIREAVALILAGEAFDDPRLASTGRAVLEREIDRQILPDGGHFERSPSYHLQVMMDLREATVALGDDRLRTSVEERLRQMALPAAVLLHPDSVFPLFNDCSRWPTDVRAFLRALDVPAEGDADLFPSTGYVRFGSGDDVLFLDVGHPSPRDLPPHAHADLFSIEASVGGVRMLVNSGTGDYERGAWRDYWRSTRAHNTVEVDGVDQSEVWHSFRMARRAAPRDVQVRRQQGSLVVSAWHDGYERLRSPARHWRSVASVDGGWIVADRVLGTTPHFIRSHLHVHPEVGVRPEPWGFVLRRDTSTVSVVPLGGLAAAVEGAAETPIENWYAEVLGSRVPSKAIVMTGSVSSDDVFGWAIFPGDAPPTIDLRARDHDVWATGGTVDVPMGAPPGGLTP
jgi:uncharacterized heparinase superfamily protein